MSKKLGLPGKAADRVAVLTGIHPHTLHDTLWRLLYEPAGTQACPDILPCAQCLCRGAGHSSALHALQQQMRNIRSRNTMHMPCLSGCPQDAGVSQSFACITDGP